MRFGALTGLTTFDVAKHVLLDSRPPVFAKDEFGGLVPTGMSCDRRVVVVTDDPFPQLLVEWDVEAMSVGQ
jgi:hypothetical protein